MVLECVRGMSELWVRRASEGGGKREQANGRGRKGD